MYLLPDKTPAEKVTVTFDFSGDIASGTTLSSPTITQSVLDGIDAVGLTISSITISGQTVLALVAAGAEGVNYKLLCEVQVSGGEVRDRAASLRVTSTAV